jgi:very-short-patch-repair endonuclease
MDITNEIDLIVENNFSKNLEELLPLFTSQKIRIVEFLKYNFKENIHYIINKNNFKIKKNGGHNKVNYMLTEEVFELVKNTFNLKHRYITKIGDSRHLNIIMSLENQTIGFIENSFKDILKLKRQHAFDKYKVDLYFRKYKLVVECDENNHSDRNSYYEKERERYILSLGNTIIRFDPNDKLFDLSLVLREINKILFSKEKKDSSIILVNFN